MKRNFSKLKHEVVEVYLITINISHKTKTWQSLKYWTAVAGICRIRTCIKCIILFRSWTFKHSPYAPWADQRCLPLSHHALIFLNEQYMPTFRLFVDVNFLFFYFCVTTTCSQRKSPVGIWESISCGSFAGIPYSRIWYVSTSICYVIMRDLFSGLSYDYRDAAYGDSWGVEKVGAIRHTSGISGGFRQLRIYVSAVMADFETFVMRPKEDTARDKLIPRKLVRQSRGDTKEEDVICYHSAHCRQILSIKTPLSSPSNSRIIWHVVAVACELKHTRIVYVCVTSDRTIFQYGDLTFTAETWCRSVEGGAEWVGASLPVLFTRSGFSFLTTNW